MKIHQTAIIDKGSLIGDNTKIWHWSHMCGSNNRRKLFNRAKRIYRWKGNCRKNVKIQNNVSVYDEVKIGDNVFCGPSVVFTNVINPRAEVVRKSEYKKNGY